MSTQLGYWLIVATLFVAVPWLVTRHPSVQRSSDDGWTRLGEWLLAQVEPQPERDPLAEEMFAAVRRERLRGDLQRVQRLLATDMSMSATRQLGNRLAHDWLLRELRELRGSAPFDVEAALQQPAAPTPVRTVEVTAGRDWRRAPEVEILEIGWRR